MDKAQNDRRYGRAWFDHLERTKLEKLRAANEARHRHAWREVVDLTEREAARRAAAGPRNFGAPVPWDGVDPGPERF